MRNEFLQFQFPDRRPGRLAIEHVTVVPMDRNRVLPDHTVIIANGKIEVIAPSAELDLKNDNNIEIVDGSGRFLMPGLADMYTHYREPAEAPLYLAHGITTARTSGNPFQLGMERAAERSDFPSPRVITVTPGFDGIGPSGRTDMPHGVLVTNPQDAARLVREYAERGYHQIMPFSLLTRENLQAISTAAAERGLRVVGNCPNALSWEEAVAAGMSGFQQLHLIARDHMLPQYSDQTYWDRFDPAPGTKLDFDKIKRLGGFLAKNQIWNLPTVAFHQRASQPAEISLAHPSLRYVPRSTIDDWETTIVRWGRRGQVGAEEWRALARERAIAFQRVVQIFFDEGAPQLTCTDGLNPYNVQGDTLHQEIENFAAAGMSAFDALRCATSEAARFMGEDQLWGTLAVGKRADMILTRADPLQDVRATRDLEAVFVNGYHLTRETLDDLLEQRAAVVTQPAEIASTTLPASDSPGTVADEGAWLERICGADFGRVSYRHTRLPNGNWIIEERHSGANPRRHPMRRNTRLELGADFAVHSAKYEIESAVGNESGELRWSPGDGYQLRHVSVDGFESLAALPGEARLPSERLALSMVPRLISKFGASKTQGIDCEGAHLGPADITLATAENGDAATAKPDQMRWKLEVARPGDRVSQEYSVGPDGRLSGMTETTVLLWPRELIPVEPATAKQSGKS